MPHNTALTDEANEYLTTGRQLAVDGSHAEAREYFLLALELCPHAAQLYLALGQSFFFQKKPSLKEAAEAFQKVVALSPQWAEGYIWLGIVQEKSGDTHLAAASFEHALVLTPDDTRPMISLGCCLTQLKDFKGAIQYLRRAVMLNPHYGKASAHLFLADAFLQNGEIEAACKEWLFILTMSPEYPDYDGPMKEAKKLLDKYQKPNKA